MNVFLYFAPGLPIGKDELEDALEASLAGKGHVSGSGSGQGGSNIDLGMETAPIGKRSFAR